MAEVRPIHSLHYNLGAVPSLADVTAPPYDVITPAMRAELLGRSPKSVHRGIGVMISAVESGYQLHIVQPLRRGNGLIVSQPYGHTGERGSQRPVGHVQPYRGQLARDEQA